jgi:hypothetical protein
MNGNVYKNVKQPALPAQLRESCNIFKDIKDSLIVLSSCGHISEKTR